jgi:hypothetical protein
VAVNIARLVYSSYAAPSGGVPLSPSSLDFQLLPAALAQSATE